MATRPRQSTAPEAINPQTGERMRYNGQAWVPVRFTARELATREQIQLSEARAAARNADEVVGDLNRFENLNAVEPSGGWRALPLAREVIGAFDNEASQMNEITARLAPAQRVPGSGTTSDRDLSLFLQASPSLNRPRNANQAIITRGRAEAERRAAYSAFLDRWSERRGTLIGADEAFRVYWQRQSQTPAQPGAARRRGAFVIEVE